MACGVHDQEVSRRVVKKQQMQWTLRGDLAAANPHQGLGQRTGIFGAGTGNFTFDEW